MSVENREAGARGVEGRNVVITGAAREFGRTLAVHFARRGANVFLAARTLEAATRAAQEIRDLGHEHVTPFACDLSDAASVRAFAEAVGEVTDQVDILVNNAARWLEGIDLLSADDDDISDTLTSGATGTVLVVKHLLPLLRASEAPDIVTLVSMTGEYGNHRSSGHPAYYAAKHAQAGFTEILSKRLRGEGIRVISLYPPDFANPDPLAAEWDETPRGANDMLTAHSVVECILFAVNQPRDCFIKSFYFEQAI